MADDRIFKELDRLHDRFTSVDARLESIDGKVDKLRDELYDLGKKQATYTERVDTAVTRVTSIENEQKAARRLAVTILVTVLVGFGSQLLGWSLSEQQLLLPLLGARGSTACRCLTD
jgi:hypothetical protein